MKFSLLTSIYFKEKPEYINACFDSIIKQTVPPDEIVLVKDGILPNALNICIKEWIQKFRQTEIEFNTIQLEENKGLAVALNTGLKKCKFDYIARMDIDDVCYLDRFEKQLHKIEENPDIALLGGQIAEYSEDMKELQGYRIVPVLSSEINKFIKRRNPFNHPTVIFKKVVVESVGGYPDHLKNWQDYALWCKIIANGYLVCNLPDILVKMRSGDKLIKRRSGLLYIKYELQAYKYVFNTGLISSFEYGFYICIKLVVRFLPHSLKKYFYKLFLRKSDLDEIEGTK